MTLRLWLLNLILRLVVRTALGMVKTPQRMREQFDKTAQRFFMAPDDANFVPDTIRRNGDAAEPGLIEAVWASRGRPDRHRVILYLHGGAYLSGSQRTHRHLAAWLAGAAGTRALVPDYRLAPEHRFPAAVEDAVAAYRHLLGAGYAARHIALAGDSAGGGLIFALLQRIAALGLPPPACVVAFSPWTDLTLSGASMRRNARREVMLPVRRAREVVDYYMGDGQATDPLASPALGSYRDPPPALILASSAEVLCDDATAMADRLRAAGGDVSLELWKDMPHAWPYFVGYLPAAEQTIGRVGKFIAKHLEDGERAAA